MIPGSDEYILDCFRVSVGAGLAASSPWYCTLGKGGDMCRYRARCEELDGKDRP